jgi:hypothetical protein
MSNLRKSCASCDAFLPNPAANPKAGQARQGWCRANPPGLMETMQPHPVAPGQMVRVQQGVWPPTAADQWCRAWQLAEEQTEMPDLGAFQFPKAG